MLMSTALLIIGLASLNQAKPSGWKKTPEMQERTQLCYVDIFNIQAANFESVKLVCENETGLDEMLFWYTIKKMGKHHMKGGWKDKYPHGEPWPEGEVEGEPWPEGEVEGEPWPEGEMEGEPWPEGEMEGEPWPEGEMEGEPWPEGEVEGEPWPEGESEDPWSESGSSEECEDGDDSSSEESEESNERTEAADDEEEDYEKDSMKDQGKRRKMRRKCGRGKHGRRKHGRRKHGKHMTSPPTSYAGYKTKIGKASEMMQRMYEKFETCKGKRMGYLNNDNMFENDALKTRIEEAAGDNERLKKHLLDRLDACVDEEQKFFYLCMKIGCKDGHKMYGKKYKCVEE